MQRGGADRRRLSVGAALWRRPLVPWWASPPPWRAGPPLGVRCPPPGASRPTHERWRRVVGPRPARFAGRPPGPAGPSGPSGPVALRGRPRLSPPGGSALSSAGFWCLQPPLPRGPRPSGGPPSAALSGAFRPFPAGRGPRARRGRYASLAAPGPRLGARWPARARNTRGQVESATYGSPPGPLLNKTTIYFVQFRFQLKCAPLAGRAKPKQISQNRRSCSKKGLHTLKTPYLCSFPEDAPFYHTSPPHVKSHLTVSAPFSAPAAHPKSHKLPSRWRWSGSDSAAPAPGPRTWPSASPRRPS